MIKKSMLALLLLVLAAAVVVSCAKNGPLAPAAQPQQGSIMVKMDVLDNVSSGTVNVTQGPLSFTSSLTMNPLLHGAGTASFTDLQTGTWTVTAKLYDSSSTLKYYATGTASVSLYQTTSVNLSITAGGKLAITVGIPGNDFLFLDNWNDLCKFDSSGTRTAIPGMISADTGACNPRSGGVYYYAIVNGTSINCLKKDGSWNQVLIDNSHGEAYYDCNVRPSWDGTKIAFYHKSGTTNTAYCIGVGNVSGGSLTSYQYIPKVSTSEIHPIWTADGRIVFNCYNGSNNEIWIMNSDGSNRSQIQNIVGTYPVPTDCSASNQLIYSSTVSGNHDIYRINLDGTNNTKLTSVTYPTIAAWGRLRNDDSVIIYDQYVNSTSIHSIYTMNNDSTGSSKTLIDVGVTMVLEPWPCFMY